MLINVRKSARVRVEYLAAATGPSKLRKSTLGQHVNRRIRKEVHSTYSSCTSYMCMQPALAGYVHGLETILQIRYIIRGIDHSRFNPWALVANARPYHTSP